MPNSTHAVFRSAFRVIPIAFFSTALFFSYAVGAAAKQNPAPPVPAPCVSNYGGHCADLAAMASRGELAQVGLEFLKVPEGATFGQILSHLYVFGIGLVGISALIMVVFGGVKYMTAAGSPQRIGDAKSMITNALFGVALALTSWILLYTINPDLVRVLDLESTLDRSTLQNAATLESCPGGCNAGLVCVNGTCSVP